MIFGNDAGNANGYFCLNGSLYKYVCFTHSFFPEENSPCLAYGITLYRGDKANPKTLDTIYAVTTKKEKIEQITALLNRAQVSPYHFRDVLEDLLASGIPDKDSV